MVISKIHDMCDLFHVIWFGFAGWVFERKMLRFDLDASSLANLVLLGKYHPYRNYEEEDMHICHLLHTLASTSQQPFHFL